MLKKIDNKGSALVSLVMLIALLGVLINSILFMVASENQQAVLSEGKKRAYYLARSGADAMASYIINHPEEASEIVAGGISNPTSIDSSEDYFVVAANTIPGSMDLMITAEGYAKQGNSTYNEKVMLRLKYGEQTTSGGSSSSISLDTAIYTNTLNVTDPNNLEITSPVVAYGEAPSIPSTVPYVNETKEFMFPEFPETPTNLTPSTTTKPTTLQNNYYYTNGLVIDKNISIIVPTIIRTKSLLVEKGSEINVAEGAILKIFIDADGVFNIKQKSFFNTNLVNSQYVFQKPSRVYIYHMGRANFILDASYLSAHVYLINGRTVLIENDAKYSGNLILEEDDTLGATITMENASFINNSVIYAPYSDIQMYNQVILSGTIVAYTLELNNDSTIQQVENTGAIDVSEDLELIVIRSYSLFYYN